MNCSWCYSHFSFRFSNDSLLVNISFSALNKVTISYYSHITCLSAKHRAVRFNKHRLSIIKQMNLSCLSIAFHIWKRHFAHASDKNNRWNYAYFDETWFGTARSIRGKDKQRLCSARFSNGKMELDLEKAASEVWTVRWIEIRTTDIRNKNETFSTKKQSLFYSLLCLD